MGVALFYKNHNLLGLKQYLVRTGLQESVFKVAYFERCMKD